MVNAQQPVTSPLGHGGDELARVAVGVPLAGVGIVPLRARLVVQVVEDPLHHPRVEQEPLDLLAVPGAALVRRLAVDMEGVADDGDVRFARRALLARVSARIRTQNDDESNRKHMQRA